MAIKGAIIELIAYVVQICIIKEKHVAFVRVLILTMSDK